MKLNGFWRLIIAMCAFYALTALFQLVTVSLISFFHFLLDHKLGVIEDWVFDKGWEIVVLVKLCAFFVVQKFIHLSSNSRQPFRDMVLESWKRPSRSLFALCVASFLIIIFVSSPTGNVQQEANIFKALISYISVSTVILIDVFLLLSLRFHFGFSLNENRISLVFVALLFWLGNRVLFPFAQGFEARDFFLHLTVLQLTLWQRDNWSDPAFFIALVVAPTVALLGFDPVWGIRFSLFVPSVGANVSFAAGIWMLATGFLWWRAKIEQTT